MCSVVVTEGESFKLKENHNYWHQIQGQLHVTGKEACDLVVWTKKDTAIIRIGKDASWLPNMHKMIDFYFNSFIPSFK